MNYDVVIVGSGIVGATLCCALAQKTGLHIGLFDAHKSSAEWSSIQYDHRVSAISPQSQTIFQALDVWKNIAAKRISRFTKMQVWDASSEGSIHFDSRKLGKAELGLIIENNVLRSSLLDLMGTYSQVELRAPIELTSATEMQDHMQLTTADGEIIRTNLLLGADGTHSWVREQFGIEVKKKEDAQIAIVTTVKTELPHEQTAWQRFLPSGPLAFLPLEDPNLCSIVWSLPAHEAAFFVSLDEETFKNTLAEKFAYKLGKILDTEKRHQFPLQRQIVKNYVRSRLALLGDAAHTIHPLAGQGVNLGLYDAMCLSEVIQEALEKKRDFASFATLRRYERARKGNNYLMFTAIELLDDLFATKKTSLTKLRGLGLNATDRVPWIKNLFTDYAFG